MPLTLNNTNTLTADNIFVSGTNLSDLYATINYVNSNSGGISQQDVDDSLAPLISKDIAYNSTLTSHISLIDTNTTDIATHTNDIAVLNTKQIQNFAGITDINTNLTNNYQTNSQLSNNFYNKTEIDTTLGNYYTQAVANTVFYSQTYVNNNTYTKTEVDGLIAGAGASGYTDAQIDNFLNLKEDKSAFADNISFFPVIDLSRPSIIHQGLTLNNSTVNISPEAGLLFSNQFGAGADRVVSIFKNQTNYITLQGNKIIANATSDDSLTSLNLNPSNAVVMNNATVVNNLIVSGTTTLDDLTVNGNATIGNISFTDLTVSGTFDLTGDATFNNRTMNISNSNGIHFYKNTNDVSEVFRVGNDVAYMLFRAWFIDCKRTSDDTDTTLYLQWNTGGDVRIGNTSAQVAIATLKDPAFNLNVGGSSQFEIIRASNYLFVPTGSIYVNSAMKMYQRADAFNSLNIITSQQINFSLQSNKEADPTTGTIALQINDATNIVMNRPVMNNQTIYSLGDITTEGNLLAQGTLTSQGNFSLQGQLLFQHSSAIDEVLNGSDYDLLVWNGDTDRSIIFRVGTIGSTPELQLNNDSVNLLGHLDITHATVSTSERLLFNNPDADGMFIFSLNSGNKFDIGQTTSNFYGNLYVQNNIEMGSWLDITHTTESGDVEVIQFNNSDTNGKFVHSVNSSTKLQVSGSGVDVFGTLYTDVNGITSDGGGVFAGALTASAFNTASDFRLKENIKEIPTKTCYNIVKYVKVKEFNMKGKENKQVGFIAQDVVNSKVNEEWSNIVSKGKDDFLRIDYGQMGVISWGAIQYLMNEITNLKSELTKMKNKDKLLIT